MANDVVNVTEGSGKAIATETVTTLNAQTVTARDVQRVGLVNISGDGIADDIKPLGEGTPITGQSLEAGGAGALGWFASIRKKIAAFGVAGTPSVDVLTVQGIGGGTPQPITSSIFATSRFTSAVVNASTSGNNTLIAGTVGQTIRVFAIDLMMAGAVNIKFRDGASTDLSAAQPFYAGGGKVLDPFPSGDPLFVCTAGNDFVLNLSAAVAVTGTIWYTKG